MLLSCTTEDINKNETISEETKSSVIFRVAIPEMEISTKSKDEITGLDPLNFYVMVFDENGLFLEKSKAIVNGQIFQVVLTLSPKKRIIHFIGNNNLSGFSDAANYMKSEKEIIASMEIRNEVTYWNRIELASGISQSTFPGSIQLIRNIAKISLQNNTSSVTGGYPRLENLKFSVINQLEYGTIAPFKKTDGTFPENWVTEANTNTVLPLSSFSVNPVYVYEKINKGNPKPLAVIIQGDYKASASAIAQPSFYKIDFIDNTSPCGILPIDIIRNNHYLINLKSVARKGYATADAAIGSPADNNIINSIELQDLKTISDGKAVLTVDDISLILVKINTSYEIKYNYYPNGLAGGADNSGMSITLYNDDDSKPVLNSINTAEAGKIKFTTISTYPIAENRTGYIRICKNGLSRIIRLTFKYPYLFENAYFTPNQIAIGQNKDVVLNFNISASVPSSEFPLSVYIDADRFSPAPNSGLEVDASGGRYRYIYKATSPGLQTVQLKTAYSNSSDICILQNPLFSDVAINFEAASTVTKTYISSWFDIKPRYILKSQALQLNIFLPANTASVSTPAILNINGATNLEIDPQYSTTGIMTDVTTLPNGTIQYNAKKSGEVVTIYLRSKTDFQTNAITISNPITSPKFVTTADLNNINQ